MIIFFFFLLRGNCKKNGMKNSLKIDFGKWWKLHEFFFLMEKYSGKILRVAKKNSSS
jgi:hypothetical protein